MEIYSGWKSRPDVKLQRMMKCTITLMAANSYHLINIAIIYADSTGDQQLRGRSPVARGAMKTRVRLLAMLVTGAVLFAGTWYSLKRADRERNPPKATAELLNGSHQMEK